MLILPDDRPEGEAPRDAALAWLRVRRAALVRDLARAAVRLALDRGTLTADDVRAVVPIPEGIRPVVVGVVFSTWRTPASSAGSAIDPRPAALPMRDRSPSGSWPTPTPPWPGSPPTRRSPLTDPATSTPWPWFVAGAARRRIRSFDHGL